MEEEAEQKVKKERKETYMTRFLRIYCSLFRQKYGFSPMLNIARYRRPLKALVEARSEKQIQALLFIFFNWYGMTGNDQREQESLQKATFNPQWFFSCVNSYEAYARNVLGINLDNEPEVDKFLKDNYK